MDCIKFSLPCKAFSINAAHYATRKVKTKECRAWEEMILFYIKEATPAYRNGLPEFKGEVDITIDIIYPEAMFWNKDKCISAKTYDVSNCEKLLIDVIFGQWLFINDRYIRKMVSTKNPGSGYQIDVTLEFHSYNQA